MTIGYHIYPALLGIIVQLSLSGCEQHAQGDKNTGDKKHAMNYPETMANSAPETIHTGKLSGAIELAGHCGNAPSIGPDACRVKPFAAEVVISRQSDPTWMQRVRSDEKGRFELELAPGLYRITVEASRFMTSTEQTVHVLPDDHQHIVLSLHPRTF